MIINSKKNRQRYSTILQSFPVFQASVEIVFICYPRYYCNIWFSVSLGRPDNAPLSVCASADVHHSGYLRRHWNLAMTSSVKITVCCNFFETLVLNIEVIFTYYLNPSLKSTSVSDTKFSKVVNLFDLFLKHFSKLL